MKARIFLMGRHANRTPFAYPALRPLLQHYFEYSDSAINADFLVFGFVIDIQELAEELLQIRQANPAARLVVVSEEPLWDSLWSGEFWKRNLAVQRQGAELPYTNLNHVTCDIYEFEHFPYFITTDDRYFVRYAHYFKRNSQYASGEILQTWKQAEIRYAFYCEKRCDPKFAAEYQEHGIQGITNLRSQIAELCQFPGTLRVGKGWGDFPIRQSLPDWHLDKLAALDLNAWFVSALENTAHDCYITEKLFDAYAVLGIPIYFASKTSRLSQLVDPESLINCWQLDAAEVCVRLGRFKATQAFVDRYRSTLTRLCELFSAPGKYIEERQRMAAALASEFNKL